MLKRKQPIIVFAVLIAILVLELLPYGAVLNFANAEGEVLRTTYSYFDPTPYGNANFGPFITAILTCILLVMSIVYLIADKSNKIQSAIKIVSFVALIVSLAPLHNNCFSVIGGAISILLLVIFVTSILEIRK